MNEVSPGFAKDLITVVKASGPEGRMLLILTAINNLFTAVLDAVGVGAIIPFMAVVTMPDLFVRYPVLRDWVPQAMQDSRAQLIFAGVGIFALIYCLRAIFTLVGAYMQARLQGTLTLHISDRLFGNYLQRGYAYHLEKGPSFFSARLGDAIGHAQTTIMSVQQLSVELLTGLLILGLVVAANPFAALISLLGMGIPAVIIYRWLRQRIQDIGHLSHLNWEQMSRALYTGISAIKDIKVFGTEAYFHSTYTAAQFESRDLSSRSTLYSNAPRVIIELCAVLAVLGLCIVLTWQNRLQELVLVMGLYAAAAFRLMPCANRILMALTQLRRSRYGLTLVATDLRHLGEDRPIMTSTEAQRPKARFEQLAVEGVSFRYRADLPCVLEQVSLSFAVGESIGFVGSSGAGKSSLVDIVLGLLKPEQGCIRVNGRNIEDDLRSWRQRIGYVPQAIYLIDDSIRRNVAFGLADDEVSDAQVWHALEAARLKDFVNELPQGLDTSVGERGVKLSGGQRQRIGIARALYHQPDVLILDEATSALDNATEAEFMQAINALHGEKTILMVAHRLSTVRHCDRIVVMQRGQVADVGRYDDLAEHSPVFQQIAGREVVQAGS